MRSDADSVVEVAAAAPEPALIQELKPSAHLFRQCALAAADDDRVEEEVAFVDEIRGDRLAGKLRTTDGEVRYRRLLDLPAKSRTPAA